MEHSPLNHIERLHIWGEINAERLAQVKRFGPQTGLPCRPEWSESLDRHNNLAWSQLYYCQLDDEQDIRDAYEDARAKNRLTRAHITAEEFAEVMNAASDEHRREELVQLAATCVAWIETIDARSGK